MTTQELVERLHDWIEDNATIDWPYPTLPADRAEVLSAAASRLSKMDAENKRLEDALKRIEELEAEIKSLRWALKSLVQSCTTGIKIDDRDIGVKMPSAWQVDAARAALTQEKQT